MEQPFSRRTTISLLDWDLGFCWWARTTEPDWTFQTQVFFMIYQFIISIHHIHKDKQQKSKHFHLVSIKVKICAPQITYLQNPWSPEKFKKKFLCAQVKIIPLFRISGALYKFASKGYKICHTLAICPQHITSTMTFIFYIWMSLLYWYILNCGFNLHTF